jgi:hypothetical protein
MASNFFMQLVQQSFYDATSQQFFTESPSIKSLNDLMIKWATSKLTCSEKLELFKNICWSFSV